MGEAQVDPPIVPDSPVVMPSRKTAPSWARALAGLAVILLLGFILDTGRTLWAEWGSLQQDQVRERDSAIVGYLNINPDVSYAARPDNWSHDEGEDSLLWAGWKDGQHRWFRFAKGGLDPRKLSLPIGRDAIQAIDYPVYEREGDPRWGRVPAEASVVGFEQDGAAIAYPMKVLQKVLVVNEQIGDRSFLVTYTPGETVSVYEATLEGHRVTLGHGGYFRERSRPLLYDRGTESLWSEGKGGMVAVAGRRKGATLKFVAKPPIVAWSRWRNEHPDGLLVIGADRSKAMPAD